MEGIGDILAEMRYSEDVWYSDGPVMEKLYGSEARKRSGLTDW